MHRILIIAGLCLLILPFFLLGDPPSVQLVDLDRAGGVVPIEEVTRSERRSAELAVASASSITNESDTQKQSIEIHQRIVVETRRSVRFRVVDSETEEVVKDYRLRIYRVGESDSRFFHATEIEARNEIQLPLPVGSLEEWILEIHAPGYSAFQQDLWDCVDEYAEDTSEVMIEKGAFFTGRILDQNGYPVPGVEVDADVCDSAVTDPDGVFAMSLPDPDDKADKILLTAEKEDVGSVEFDMRIADYPKLHLPDLVLKGTGVLQGMLLFEDGTPLRGFRVTAQHVDGTEEEPVPPGIAWATTTTDVRGRFRMKGMASGRYELWMDRADIDGRKLGSYSSISLHPNFDTGHASVWRFKRLDVEVHFPPLSKKREVEVKLMLPGGEGIGSLSWDPASNVDAKTLAIQVGTRLEFTASVPGHAWVNHSAVMWPGQARQQLRIVVPDPATWVPVTLTVRAPTLVKHKRAIVELLVPIEGWRWMETAENQPGIFQFRIPPGLQQIRLSLQDRLSVMRCGHGSPTRAQLPEYIPFHAWLTAGRTLQVHRGGSHHLQWQPRPQASMTFLFECVGSPQALPKLQDVTVSRVDPLDPARKRVLDRDQPGRVRWGEAEWFQPELTPGRHLFRFQAKGYEPVVRELWLKAKQDRLVRIQLRPAVPARVRGRPVPEMTEPYRCGRASK